MAILALSNTDYQILAKLKDQGWHLEQLSHKSNFQDIVRWCSTTLGYRSRDLNPRTYDFDGRWDCGRIFSRSKNQTPWIAFRDEQDYLMYKIKFSA